MEEITSSCINIPPLYKGARIERDGRVFLIDQNCGLFGMLKYSRYPRKLKKQMKKKGVYPKVEISGFDLTDFYHDRTRISF